MTDLAFKARKLFAIAAERSWRDALRRYRVAAGVEHAAVLRNLGAVASVVDIGANRGQFALVARHCLPNASIVSFEPLPAPAGKWRSVFAGDDRATLVQAAIGPERAKAEIHLSARDDSSSMLPISSRQSELFAGTAATGRATIDIGPLDGFVRASEIRTPALLKIDVQGFELQALEGCASCIDRFEWVYVECSFVELYERQAFADEVINWLSARGLKLNGVYNVFYDAHGVAVQADFLFGRQ